MMKRGSVALVVALGLSSSAFAQEADLQDVQSATAAESDSKLVVLGEVGSLAQLEAAVKADPEAAISFYVLGLSYFQLGRHQDAIDAFKKPTELSPYDDESFHALGLSLRHVGKLKEAISAFETARSLNDTAADISFDLGTIHLQLGQFDDAAQALPKRHALSLNLRPPTTMSRWPVSKKAV